MKSTKVSFKTLIAIFIAWRIFLFLPFFITLGFLTVQKDFLGGGREAYLSIPYLWGWANFDGEHYLSIARHGYQPLTYFFFPLYPLLIRFLASPFPDVVINYLYSGLVISHLCGLLTVIGLWKLLRLDYKTRTVLLIILSVILFPTSFFLVGFYTESLFLALVVWSFYCARRQRWGLVAVLGTLATATRVIGILLLPALLIEWWQKYKGAMSRESINALICIAIVPLGLSLYMLFLYQKTGDPIVFFHEVGLYGEQRSTNLILLPQVFYRYIFKIIPNVPVSYLPGVFTLYLEFSIGIIFFILSIYALFRLRASYALYLLSGYLVPTLSGSFSSLPRYVLVLFPGFIIFGLVIGRLPKVVQMLIFVVMAVSLTVAQALFVRGYWLS